MYGSYVSAMVPVKTMKEYDLLQDLTVLFCETVDRSVTSISSVSLSVCLSVSWYTSYTTCGNICFKIRWNVVIFKHKWVCISMLCICACPIRLLFNAHAKD